MNNLSTSCLEEQQRRLAFQFGENCLQTGPTQKAYTCIRGKTDSHVVIFKPTFLTYLLLPSDLRTSKTMQNVRYNYTLLLLAEYSKNVYTTIAQCASCPRETSTAKCDHCICSSPPEHSNVSQCVFSALSAGKPKLIRSS